jgi:asparagine synthase (glutamine-hydrolysing)
MNSIFGRINTSKNQIDQKLFNESIDKLCVFSQAKKELITEDHWGLGQVIFYPFISSIDKNRESNPALTIVSDSKLYNKTEILNKLEIPDKSFTDDFLILKAFEKWGKDCLKYLLGDFAFAIWDSEKEELFCARDHFGVKPFNYYSNDDSFVFSSDIPGILAQNDIAFSVDEQYIADSISIVKSEKIRTTYNEIRKLPPAHYLILKQNKIEITQYWELQPQKTISKNNTEIIEEFKSLLIESVKCRSTGGNSVGTELSGGIDSSSVTAIASQFIKSKTFSHVLPDHLLDKIHPFKDEREYVNLLADYCEISERHFVKSENKTLIEVISENVSAFNGITQQNFGVFSDHLYNSAMQENVSVLLSGFGGDEVVTSKSLGYLTELASKKQWEELKRDLKNQKLNTIQYLKALLKYYLKSQIPLIAKIVASIKYGKPWWFGKFENLAINEDFSEQLNIKERYFANYEKAKNLSLQEKNIERITHPHASQRLEYCSLIARKYGIEYRYPLLDIRLLEFYLAMPTRLKARNGVGRYAIRKAIEGIVPEKIQQRNDKSGATIPSVFMRMINDKEEILEIIKRAKRNEAVKKYIDLEKYEQWFHKFCQRSDIKQKHINPGAFYNYLKLILFIEQNPAFFE